MPLLRDMLDPWKGYPPGADRAPSLVGAPVFEITNVYRRLRPTIVLTPRNRRGDDTMRCLAVLCMHSIGLYQNTWAGALVPSDDVLSHLVMMRADEAYFWRCANQHDPRTPEAGL